MHHAVNRKTTLALLLLSILLLVSACGKAPTEETPSAITEPTETTVPVEATEATTAPTETEPAEERFVLTLVGDCTLGCTPWHEYTHGGFIYIVGDDYDYPFQNVREYFENDDFTLVNFEGTLGDEGYPANKAFTFRGPAEYTNILTGSSVEAVTLANNHTMDFGYAGYKETTRILTEAEVPFVEKDSSRLVTTESGLTIGLYAAAFVIDQKDLSEEVAALREQGAEIVIFAIHWGTEGNYHAYIDQSKAAYKAIDAGVDIVYGHHPHVLQKIEEYNGGVIFYSLGNFCFGGNQQPSDLDSALLQQEIIRDPDGNISLGERTIIPCSISSIPFQNNYQPTPYEEGSEEYERVLAKLSGRWNGKNVIPVYEQDTESGFVPLPTTTPTVPTEPAVTPTGPSTQPETGTQNGGTETGSGTETGGGTETPNPSQDSPPAPPPTPDPPAAPDTGTGDET